MNSPESGYSQLVDVRPLTKFNFALVNVLSPHNDFEVMLGETLIQRVESNLDNIKNSKPSGFTSHHAGASLNKTRQALLKKGGRRLRSSPAGLQGRHHHCPLQHPKHHGVLRSNPTRFTDINNNTVVAGSKPPVPSNADTAASRTQTSVLTLHQLKQGAKKEVIS